MILRATRRTILLSTLGLFAPFLPNTHAQTIIFSDSFNRVEGTPTVNGSDGGTSTWGANDNAMGGSIAQTYEIGPAVRSGNRHQYVFDPTGATGADMDGEARFRAGWSEIQYDFGNSSLVDAGGGLTIEFDSRVADLTPGWLSMAIGQPGDETNDEMGQNPIFTVVEDSVDFGILFKGHIDEYQVFEGGDDPDAFVAAQSGTWQGGDDANNEMHFRFELATSNLGESGTQATVNAFVTNSFNIENQILSNYTFTWDNDGEAYIAFSSNKDQGAAMQTENPAQEVSIDNLVIATITTVITPSLVCDFDNDDACRPADLDLLYDNFNTDMARFDLNSSGTVEEGDIANWLTAASSTDNPYNTTGATFRSGDVNFSGSVDSNDLGILLNNFGSTAGLYYEDGNLNGDANVDSSDLGRLLNSFGVTSSAATVVPEPSSGVGGLFLLAALLARATRRSRRS